MNRKFATILTIISAILLLLGVWPIALPLLAIGIFFLSKNANHESKDKQRQHEIDRKKLDIAQKSNEILLHLLQDEHQEGDR